MIVTMDTTGLSFVGGVIEGMGRGINKSNFIGSAIDVAHNVLNTEFEQWMDLAALADKSSLMHVYEWGQLGIPQGRLWESFLVSTGGFKTKRSVVSWKPSSVPTPVRSELLEPGPTGKTVKEGVHVFVWKAPVMEAGLEITVSPQASGSGSLAYMAGGQLRITKKPSRFEAGGGNTTGQFTSHYYTWWNTMAQGVYQKQVAPKFQANVTAAGQAAVRRRRTFYRIAGSDSASFTMGANVGVKAIAALNRNFEAEAAARRVMLYGA